VATVAHVDARFTADTASFVRSIKSAQQATSNFTQGMRSVNADARNIAAGVGEAGRAADQAKSGFTVLKGAMAAAFGLVVIGGITKVAGALKGFAMGALNTAARVEELDIAMKAIGESTGQGYEAIKSASDAIRANGIEMGAAQQIAIEFAQNQLDMASASTVARVAQDLAVIGGKNSTQTTQMLTRAIITGNSILLKSAGISRTASEGYQEYAESLGKGVRQLTSVEKRQAITNLIIAEGAKVAGTYEASMDSAGKVLRSFPRIYNDIQVEAGAVLTAAFGPLIKSTYNLVSAFSKALRSGGSLSGVLASVTKVMVKMTEPMVEIIDNFTEMVKSGEIFDKVSDVVNSALPTFLALAGASRSFAQALVGSAVPALKALLDALAVVLRAVQPLANAFAAMPDVVKIAVGALIFFQTALGARLLAGLNVANIALIRFGTTFKSQMLVARGAAGTAAASVVASLTGVRVAMEMAVISSKKMAAGIVLAFRSVATAAKGFLASLGPIGIALIAAAAAFEIFSGKSAASEELIAKLKATADDATDSINGLSLAAASAQFRTDLSFEDIQMMESYGITIGEMAAAALEGGAAAEDMQHRLSELGEKGAWDLVRSLLAVEDAERRVFSIATTNFEGMVKDSQAARDEQVRDALAKADAEERAARKIIAANEQIQFSNRAGVEERRRAIEEMTSSERARHDASMAAAAQEAETQSMLQRVTNATRDAVIALNGAYTALTDVFSSIRAEDRVTKAHRDMKTALKESAGAFRGSSDEAMAAREAVMNYGDQQIALAQSLKNPQKELGVLTEAYDDTLAALTAAGVKDPGNTRIVKALKAAKDAAKQEVSEMGDAVEAAKEGGLDVAEGIAAGIALGMSEQESAVNAAGVLGGQAAVDGANDGAGTSSPSTKTTLTGRFIGQGLVKGLESMEISVRATAEFIGDAMVDGIVLSINYGGSRLNAAIRALIAAALQAAKDAAVITSPSKATQEIGNQLVAGLTLGIEQSTPQVADAATGMIRSLRDSGEMAIDGFVAGMESRRSVLTSSLASIGREAESFSPMVSGRMTSVRAALPTMNALQGDSMSGGQSSGGIHIENLNVTSAPGERADTSIPRNLRRMAWVAGLDG
jgi:hypothetical protein